MNPVLLFLLLPLEFMQPIDNPQYFVLYQNLQPTAHVALLPEDAAAAPADAGVFRIKVQPFDAGSEQADPAVERSASEAGATGSEGNEHAGFDFLRSDNELIIEQSRRRSSVYTVHSAGTVPAILDLTEIASQIPHTIAATFGMAGETLLVSEQSGVYLDFFSGMVIIRQPSDGLMLVWTQHNTQE